jgi:hypothetical protein
LGQAQGVAVGGVVTGVMVRGGINVVPLASAAEALEIPVWTGSVFIYAPVWVDWAAGQWSEGEQCFAHSNGTLQPTGCNLRVAANPRPVQPGSSVTLYSQPVEDPYDAQQVTVRGGAPAEFLAARAIAHWKDSGNRIVCTFDDVWLRVRMNGPAPNGPSTNGPATNGIEGWIRPEANDVVALGLPADTPQ